MRHTSSKKTGFLSFILVAVASLASLFLTGCSETSQTNSTLDTEQHTAQNSPQNYAKNSPASGALDTQKMEHSTQHDMGMMNLGPADANYDLRFIDAMIPHHQGAVKMAKQAQEKSSKPEIKKLTADIIKAQEKEIQQMQQWRKEWYPQANSKPMIHDSHTGNMKPMSDEQINSMMMQTNLGAADPQFDLRFINAMIPHHEGAITMAQDALNKSKRPEITKMAEDIISSQKTEIDQMKQWRQTWYKQ